MRPVVVVHVSYFILPRTLSRLFDVNLWLLLSFTCLFFIIRHLRYFPLLVVPLVRPNTAVVAATWTNALGGRVAVSARRASITKTSAATSASARSATWANIATWKSSLAPPSPPRPISSLLSSLVWPPSSVCLTPHGLSLDCYLSSSPFHLFFWLNFNLHYSLLQPIR